MIWVKIDISFNKNNTIYLPKYIVQKLHSPITLRYGMRKKRVFVDILNNNTDNYKSSFTTPEMIGISSNLIDEFLINTSPVYQMIMSNNTIIIGPVVGLLLGDLHYCYNNKDMHEFSDAMGKYHEIGGLIVAFKASSINWKELLLYGLYFDFPSFSWKYGKFPIPSTIFRRSFQGNEDIVNKLKKVAGATIFNSKRFDKWEIYKKLKENINFKKYLPDTKKLNSQNDFSEFFEKYPEIILKPAGLSRGRGICIFHKYNNNNIEIYDYEDQTGMKYLLLNTNDLNDFLMKKNFINKDYIMQPHLELAKINGSPFDIRIVMEKTRNNNWECKGIECRHAGPNDLITNIARGGQALPIKQTAKLAFGPNIDPLKFETDVINISKMFCSIMDVSNEVFGEFGLDLAVDKNMNFWFIEANVRPSFKGFKKLDYNIYLEICESPIFYAVNLSGFERQGENLEKQI